MHLALKEANERGDSVQFGQFNQAGKTVSLKETIHTYHQQVDHYPICMFSMPSTVRGLEEFVPNVCTQEPATGKAFCVQHCCVFEREGIPTDLRPFIRYCGANPDNYSKEEKKKVETKLQEICGRQDQAQNNLSVPDVQGTSSFYENLGMKVRLRYMDVMMQTYDMIY